MGNSKKKCVYCDQKAPLTKEHVIPKFFYKHYPDSRFGYNYKAEKYLSWEAIVKDVCSNCNNNYLSKIDAYAKKFFQNNRIDKLITTERTVSVFYDYELLSRMLLKFTFNFLRFKGAPTNIISKFKDFILYGQNHYPSSYRHKIAVEVVPCYKVKESDKKKIKNLQNIQYIRPHIIRMGDIYLPYITNFKDTTLLRYIFFYNYYFYLFIVSGDNTKKEMDLIIKYFLKSCKTAEILNPNKRRLTIKVAKNKTCLDTFELTAMALYDKWENYLNTQQ